MSPSPVVNVVRYSALIGGIGYGILHRRTLQKEFDERILKKEQKVQDDLIKKAKEEYAKLQAAKAPVAPSSSTSPNPLTVPAVVTNPDDPNFDLEKAFAQWEKQ